MAAKKSIDFSLPKPKVDCAHEGCRQFAVVREHLPTGWANLCEFHWLEEHTKRANRNNEARGLFTTEQRIEYCRKILGKRLPRYEREPGQDDEEKAA